MKIRVLSCLVFHYFTHILRQVSTTKNHIIHLLHMLKHTAMDTPIESRYTGKMVQTEKTFAESTLISTSYNPVAEK